MTTLLDLNEGEAEVVAEVATGLREAVEIYSDLEFIPAPAEDEMLARATLFDDIATKLK